MKHLLTLTVILVTSFTLLSADPAQAQEKDTAKDAKTYELLNLFGRAFERVRSQYVEEVDDKTLIQSAVRGMLNELDPHSTYLDPKAFDDMRTSTRGQFGGLGIEVTMDNKLGAIRVISPIDDTPAQKAGIRSGDLITHLNGKPVQGLTLEESVAIMRGKVGSKITITILRTNEKPFDVTIVRDIIRIESARGFTKDNVGYIRISSFTEQTGRSVEKAVESIKKELGKNVKGYVIDLRNNPGGLLQQAVQVSDAFLDKGEIVFIRARQEEDVQRFTADKGDITDGLPLVVLINEGSASASEIVAGALQDHKRAVVMGTKSFGKGSVQSIFSLGKWGGIKFTTARYYTPSDRSIQAKGIEPDIVVEQAKIEKLENGRVTREADLRGSLRNEEDNGEAQANPEAKAKEDETPKTPEERFRDSVKEDFQLSRAIDLIKALDIYESRDAPPTLKTEPGGQTVKAN